MKYQFDINSHVLDTEHFVFKAPGKKSAFSAELSLFTYWQMIEQTFSKLIKKSNLNPLYLKIL